jgi:hypothetical protein
MIPSICAVMHVDRHVVKMVLETCQILCSVHLLVESSYVPPYKLTHKNHPCNVWARSSSENYRWLCELGLELCKEYTYRYGRVHKCQKYIEAMCENTPSLPLVGWTEPAQAMPYEYKSKDDVIESYRAYYFFEKYDLFTWKNRDTPDWIVETRLLFS